jgi:hypothetical protein
MSDLYTIFEDPELSLSEPVELSSIEDDDPIVLEEQDGDESAWPKPDPLVNPGAHAEELLADPDVTITEDTQVNLSSTPSPPPDELAPAETEI